MNNSVEKKKILLAVANTSWHLYNFRLPFLLEVKSSGIKVIVAAPKDNFSDKLISLGFDYLELPMERRGLNPIRDAGLILHLWKIYRSIKPDFVFHNTIKPVLYGTFAAGMLNINRIINMISGLGYIFIGDTSKHFLLRPMVKMMYRFSLKYSSTVFFQNPDDRDYFVTQKLIDESKTKITFGSGVDLTRFTYEENKNIQKNCHFLFIGRLLKDKGLIEYVEAAKRIKIKFPETTFTVLGNIDLDNPSHITESLLQQWKKEEIITHLSEREDVRPVIRTADIVVLPSYREGVPKAILEAMAMGKPIITTDVPGCRETIVDKRNGILIPVKDIAALTTAMEIMLSNPEERVIMGKEGRRIAEEKFDVKYVTKKLMDSLS
ncbi:MAG: glycosyltransferase family 4 protein [Bacteroidetes bacterium]|nr:glycosyltransferase family 4 protein [Bacteroidota bacterium]